MKLFPRNVADIEMLDGADRTESVENTGVPVTVVAERTGSMAIVGASRSPDGRASASAPRDASRNQTPVTMLRAPAHTRTELRLESGKRSFDLEPVHVCPCGAFALSQEAAVMIEDVSTRAGAVELTDLVTDTPAVVVAVLHESLLTFPYAPVL